MKKQVLTLEVDNKVHGLSTAKRMEAKFNKDHYILSVGKKWFVTDKMPYMGTWFDSSNHRHG